MRSRWIQALKGAGVDNMLTFCWDFWRKRDMNRCSLPLSLSLYTHIYIYICICICILNPWPDVFEASSLITSLGNNHSDTPYRVSHISFLRFFNLEAQTLQRPQAPKPQERSSQRLASPIVQVAVTAQASCTEVMSEMQARVAGISTGAWHDPPLWHC